MTHSFAIFFAQATNAANAAATAGSDPSAQTPTQPWWYMFVMYGLILTMVYFAFFRPQMQAKKKQEQTIKTAKTGDRIVTTGGIHGVITNVKDTTVIVKISDNAKLELEKSHIDKITRAEAVAADSDKLTVTKV